MRLQLLRRSISAPAAAAVCLSSSPSKDAAGHAAPRRRQPGAIHHELGRKRFHSDYSPDSPPLSGWQRRRSPNRARMGAVQSPIERLAPAVATLEPLNKALPPHPFHLSSHTSCHPHADGGVKILIALCSFGSPASRAFLPRRLSDAGPSGLPRGSGWAGIRNPSQKRTLIYERSVTLKTPPATSVYWGIASRLQMSIFSRSRLRHRAQCRGSEPYSRSSNVQAKAGPL